MINNFKKNNINKKSEINDYNKIFEMFIEDYNKSKTNIKNYTKSLILNDELLYSTVIKNKYYNSVIILIEGSDFKINISLFEDKELGFEYIFNFKRKFSDKIKIYDIDKITFKKTNEESYLDINLYNFEKDNFKFNIFGKLKFYINQSNFDFDYKLENGSYVFDYNNIVLDREYFLDEVENFIEKKDVKIYEKLKEKISEEQELKWLIESKEESEEKRIFLYTLENVEDNLKKYINKKFPEITEKNDIFKFENYKYIDGIYYNEYNPNISFHINSNSPRYIFKIENEYNKYSISYYNLEKIGPAFCLEDISDLDFGTVYITDKKIVFEVNDQDNVQVAFYDPKDIYTDHIGTYNDFINEIIKKYNLEITSLKELTDPKDKIKELFELDSLQNDYSDLDKIQEPLEKLRKNLSIKINKPNIKLKAKNVK